MDRVDRARRSERIIFTLMLLASLGMCLVGLIDMARADPLPVPNRARDGAQNFCVTWAQQAIGGARKFMQNAPDMRAKDLTVIFQTREEDNADPINHEHMVVAGEDVPTSFVLLTGVYENGTPWELSADGRVWISDALRGGWLWARLEAGKGRERELLATSGDKVVQELYGYCLGTKETQRNGFIRVASNQRFSLAHTPVATAEYTKHDLCIVKGMTADDVLGRRAAGQVMESLRAELDATKMTQAQHDEQLELLLAAYAWTGTRAAFVHEIYIRCVCNHDYAYG